MKQTTLFSFDGIISLLMPALLMAMTITHNVVFFYIVIALGVLFINKPVVIFPVYFVASLSTGWFALSEGLSAGRFLSILMIVSLLVNLVLKRGTKTNIKTNIKTNSLDIALIIVFIFYCFLSSVFSLTGDMNAFLMLLQSLVVLLFFMMRDNNDAGGLYDIFFYTAIIVLVGVSVRVFSGGFDAFATTRLGNDEAGDGVNPNRIAMMAAQTGAIFGVNVLLNGITPRGIVSIICLLGVSLIVVLTGSRTGLIAVVVPFVLLALYFFKKKKKKFILPLLFLSLIIFFAFEWMTSQDVAGLNRMSMQDVIDTGGADRMRAIQIMWRYVFPQYPICGVGLGGANFEAAAAEYGMNHPCHNILFDSLSQLGFLGFIIFATIALIAFLKTYRTIIINDKNALCFLGFSVMLAAIMNGIGETVYLEKFFWNTFTICYIGNSFARTAKYSFINGKV